MKNKSRSTEQEINKVIVHHDAMLKEIQEKEIMHHNLILLLQRKS